MNTWTLQENGKKTMEHEGDNNTNCNWRARYGHQRIVTGTEALRNKRSSKDPPNYSIIKIGMYTKESRRIGESCCHHPTMEWNTSKWVT